LETETSYYTEAERNGAKRMNPSLENAPFIPADPLSLGLFSLLCVAMVSIWLFAVWRARYRFVRFGFWLAAYLLGFCGLVRSGAPLRHVIPAFPLMLAAIVLISVLFSVSEYGGRIARLYPLEALVGFQAFRLPLEWILHRWAILGTVPATMTWTGQNPDVLTGVVCLLVIPWLKRFPAAAWAAQLLGTILLVNVLRVVILSSPFPFSWPLPHPLRLLGYLPYALIGPLFVGSALTGHLILFRKLLRPRES
jgi:hypothetical protein